MRTTHGSTRSPAPGAAAARVRATPRVLISSLTPPNPDGLPARRIVGDSLEIGADLCCDGDAALAAEILYKVPGEPRWRTAPMRHDPYLDRWIGAIRFPTGGLYRYAVQAWIDPFTGWLRRMRSGLTAAALEADLLRERQRGATFLRQAAESAADADRDMLLEAAAALENVGLGAREATRAALGERIVRRMRGLGAREDETRSFVLQVAVERKRARVGAWMLLAVPARPKPQDAAVAAAVHDVARLGFDVLCLPTGLDAPQRKRFLDAARALGLEVASTWEPGRTRGRGRRAAVAPEDFWRGDTDGVWEAELEALRGFVRAGVRAFLVSEPQTWPLPFWSWLITTVHVDHPDVVFVCASSAAPKRVSTLARIGFSQTLRALPALHAAPAAARAACARFAATPLLDVARPHARVDLCAEGSAPARRVELLLAATLSPSFSVAADLERLASAEWAHDVRALHRIRRENRALQSSWNVEALETENAALLGIWRGEGRNDVLIVANLEPEHPHEGWLHVPPRLLPAGTGGYSVRDLLTGAIYTWHGERNFVRLDPQRRQVGHVLRIERPGRVSLRSAAVPGV